MEAVFQSAHFKDMKIFNGEMNERFCGVSASGKSFCVEGIKAIIGDGFEAEIEYAGLVKMSLGGGWSGSFEAFRVVIEGREYFVIEYEWCFMINEKTAED